MCFSASASFATAIALFPIGVYCGHRARTVDRTLLPLALTPLVFAAQQFCEGLVWVFIGHANPEGTRAASLAFLFFALVFWPVYIPFVGRFIAIDERVRRADTALMVLAVIACSIVYIPLLSTSRDCLHVSILHHSIRYEFESLLGFAWLDRGFWQMAYVVAVAFPLIAVRTRALRIFGFLVLASAIAAHWVFAETFVSVWCFFAGILSGWLALFYRGLRTHFRRQGWTR